MRLGDTKEADVNWSDKVKSYHAKWWEVRTARQKSR